MPSPALRPHQPDDEPFLRQVYASTRAAEMTLVNWSDEQKAAFLRMQFDAQIRHYRLHYPDARFDVVEADGVPVGRLYVARQPNDIHVIDIAILPEFRGRGFGSQLFGALLREAGEARVTVTIHVEHANPALRWYQRLGFADVSADDVYRLMEWRPDGAARAPAN